MGKGRRKTAKTGDKALYSKRANNNKHSDSGKHDDEDVDRYHQEREDEFLRLESNNHEEEEDFLATQSNQHAVMDLGVRADSDSSSDEEDDADEYSSSAGKDNSNAPHDNGGDHNDAPDEDSDDDDDDSDNEDTLSPADPRNWGRKKSAYYHGDTADLEIGQDEEDAYMEEEAARDVQTARYETMEEEDFVLSDGGDEDGKDESGTVEERVAASRDLSKFTRKEKHKLLNKQHPELLPIVSFSSEVAKELRDSTNVAASALTQSEDAAESVGATIEGQQYLLVKSLIQHSMALNVVMYLLLKSDVAEDAGSTIEGHPVLDRLRQLNSVMQKFEDRVQEEVKGIAEQTESLVQATALMQSAEVESSDDEAANVGVDVSLASDQSVEPSTEAEQQHRDPELDLESKLDSNVERAKILNEARFGLRQNEIALEGKAPLKRSRAWMSDDFGDLDDNGAKSFASTINAIEQRATASSRKRRPAPVTEELDDHDDPDDRLSHGLRMMEEELGKLSDEDEKQVSEIGEELESGDDGEANDGLGFYNAISKKSKTRKQLKESLYRVAPKFPAVESEIDGERAISRTIMKNRGLVAHKAKINRNPRVKKREQYRKALIRRKGAVREVRTDEAHKYGGEETGIKSGISRSRKLVS